MAWTNGVLDPTVFTIGFARRFATYKRATLLLSQPERLRALLFNTDRPVQMVFAGKAHPADQPGKAMIQRIQQFAVQHELRHRFVFLDDYDMAVARALYQGADIWLNTLEAFEIYDALTLVEQGVAAQLSDRLGPAGLGGVAPAYRAPAPGGRYRQ